MVSSFVGLAGALALVSLASAQTSYTNNTNTNCATASDVTYGQVYFYNGTDVMDWGVYTQSTGTCDSGSYARVHIIDPSGNDIDCGYTPLDGQLHLTSCDNYPRGYMQEGSYTLYWETVPGVGQYSWNQFSVSHTQSTVTAATPTQTLTTTPISVLTSTITVTPTMTQYNPQVTVTTPSATITNTINITPSSTTITTTSTAWYSIIYQQYALATVTALTTAPCYRETITNDYTGTRKSGAKTTGKTSKSTVYFRWWRRSAHSARDLIVRDDVANTVGIIGSPATVSITPVAVVTTITASTVTSTFTSTTSLSGVTITSNNPTPTVTVYSGQAVKTTTVTLPQVTKSVIKTKLSLTLVYTTSTMTLTKKSVTTPICQPTSA